MEREGETVGNGKTARDELERDRVLSVLKGLVGAEIFTTWCKPLQWEAEADSVRVFAPNPFYLTWLEGTLKAPLNEAFSLVAGRPLKVVFEIRAAAKPAPGAAKGPERLVVAPLESPKHPEAENILRRERTARDV